MIEQTELFDPRPPAIAERDVEWMLGELRGRGWRLACDLGARNESEKRRLRAIARASGGRVLSGQKGYHLTMEATPEDYWRGRDFLNSQANEMKARVTEIDRVWHQRPAATVPGGLPGA